MTETATYALICAITKAGYQAQFSALENGQPGIFQVVEHFNFGRGWLCRNVATNIIVPSTGLTDVRAVVALEVPVRDGAVPDLQPEKLVERHGDSPVADLSALVQRLVRRLRKAAPDDDLADKAMDYLRRNSLLGSPLRRPGTTDNHPMDRNVGGTDAVSHTPFSER